MGMPEGAVRHVLGHSLSAGFIVQLKRNHQTNTSRQVCKGIQHSRRVPDARLSSPSPYECNFLNWHS